MYKYGRGMWKSIENGNELSGSTISDLKVILATSPIFPDETTIASGRSIDKGFPATVINGISLL